jgi:glucokinase
MRVGIDIGGTKCLGVMLDPKGDVVAEARVPTPSTTLTLLDVLVDLTTRFEEPSSLGVGFPGLMNSSGEVGASAHLADVQSEPLRARLAARLHDMDLDFPVVIDNDATAATLAEWKVGAGRGIDDLVMVTLGTGIGGGFVFGGKLYRGARGYAGEIGHAVIMRDGRPCPCGRRGCWERYASGTALAEAAGTATGEDAVVAARAGDPTATRAFADFTRAVAIGLANLVNIVDPAVIVLGGGLIELGDELLDPVRADLAAVLYGVDHRAIPRIVPAQLGERAGAIGAAMLPERQSTGSR